MENLDCVDITDLDAYQATFKQLAFYCALKKNAMKERLQGRISYAIRYEDKCEDIYRKLPEWAKW